MKQSAQFKGRLNPWHLDIHLGLQDDRPSILIRLTKRMLRCQLEGHLVAVDRVRCSVGQSNRDTLHMIRYSI